MKITLNDSIPENRRPQVERLVNTMVRNPEIVWLPSRFPHLVMFVDPGTEDRIVPEKSSIFESSLGGRKSFASLTALLEERVKSCLAGPEPRA